MNFLAPLFLLGGLAVALPVVFHLVRRSSRERFTFSSLMFLKPAPPRMTRRNRLENIFLLLLRCLVICILAFAFARPFLQKPMAATPAGSSSSQIVLLVDGSASMKRNGLWADALEKAESALKKTTPADQVAILTFDDQVHTLVSFEQWAAMNIADRPALAAQRLAESKPGWRSTHLGNALIAAADVIEDADKREQHPGPKRIILITDMQEGSKLDGLQGHDWPRGLEVAVEPVKARRPTNAGLQWIVDSDDSTRPAAEAGVRIRVHNSADATHEQFKIQWAGVTGAASLDAYVPPGQSRVMPAPKLPVNSAVEQISLSGDDDDFDNTTYVVQSKLEEVNVLYLGNEAETDSSQLLYYLKRAFQDTRRQTVRVNNAGSLSSNRLAIVSSVLSATQISDVRQFLTNGGAALLVMNDAQIAGTLGQLMNVNGVNATEAPLENYAMFGQMDFTHPLLSPFADPRFGDFTKIRFWKHRNLSTNQLAGARVIASYDDNDPAILEIPVGRGRTFVFTFSWRPSDSQFALSSKFVPLLYSLLDQAGGGGTQPAQFRVGDAVDVSSFAAKSSGAVLSVRKPDGSQVQLAPGETRFAQTDQPGVYEVSASRSSLKFAVNLDPSESRTAPLPVEELERLSVPMKPPQVSVAQQALQVQRLHDADLESRQKLWRWLIVAALAVLLMETWLAGWITRRSSARVEATA